MIQVTRSQILVANPSDQMEGVLDRMSGNRVGSILVVNSGRVLGIFTERDVLYNWRSWTNQATLRRPISAFMSEPVITIKLEEISVAAQKMLEHHIRHLPVLDRKFNLVGVLSARDLLPAVGEIAWQSRIEEPAGQQGLVRLNLVTPGIGTEEILRSIIPLGWQLTTWESVEHIIQGAAFLTSISQPQSIAFIDLDGTSSSARAELFKMLIATMKNVNPPYVFMCYSGEKLSKQEEQQLLDISKKIKWHIFEKPIAIASLIEALKLVNKESDLIVE